MKDNLVILGIFQAIFELLFRTPWITGIFGVSRLTGVSRIFKISGITRISRITGITVITWITCEQYSVQARR